MMSQWERLKGRAAGKWQMPLLVLSLIMLAAAFFRAHPTPRRLPLPDAVDRLEGLSRAGLHDEVIRQGDFLLRRERGSGADCTLVQLYLARARYAVAVRDRTHTADVGRQIMRYYQQARAGPQSLTASDLEKMGRALEWQQKFSSALEHYENALGKGAERAMDLRRHMLTLRLEHFDAPVEESDQLLDQFLADLPEERLDLTLWAIERKLEILRELDRIDQGTTVLARYRDRFRKSELRDRFDYFEAWLLFVTGQYEGAEARLRTIRNRVDYTNAVHAMSGWLLGRVVMSDGGQRHPAEALSFFADVMRHHPGKPYAVASRVGYAEALAMLERHDEAIETYRVAIEELRGIEDTRLVNLDVLRISLGVASETQRTGGRLHEAVAYARLAVSLVDRNNSEQATMYFQHLAQMLSLLVVRLEGLPEDGVIASSDRVAEASDGQARALFSEAAGAYLEVARINALNEDVAARASWQAAELHARAGDRDRAAALFRAFATERPANPLVPRALLRIGQLRQVSGALPSAIETYQECYRRFPRTLDGARALVPLAQCYLAMGPKQDDLAEKTLRVILEESEVFTPQAPEYANALFLLGRVLNRSGEFERAIVALEEALARYPNDPRVWRARFLLADSFRRSGLALKTEIREARYAAEIEQMRAESSARFQAAQRLYRELIEDYELRGFEFLDRLEKVYLRHAHLYEADCHFETQNYEQALELYEEAVGLYKHTPSALAAYVQIINTRVFLGKPEEARAALARALVLVDSVPDDAFDSSVSPERRADWRRYFEWLRESDLF